MNIEEFHNLLVASKYDQEETEFLIEGFTNGFSIGYEGPADVKITSPNLKFREVGNDIILWNKVMKEVKEKRYAGPFSKIPFDNYIQSPIGLVPKDGGKDTRLIFHLSYPRGHNSTSVNANTPEELCTVKYPDFNEAVQICIKEGKNCKIAKSDMKSVFRNLGIKADHWKYLVMKAKSPVDGKIYYFVDKCLPFGASISCSHFQRFSITIKHIVQWRTKKSLVNYMDDFFFAHILKLLCNSQVNEFLRVCDSIKFPVSLEKTYWATTQLSFLGLLIDTVSQCVCIPVDKVQKAVNLIRLILENKSKKVTLNQLQKVCGFLNFLGRCVVPGRAFTRRLYAYIANDKLKPHHHIRVNTEMRQDLEMWLTFLNHPTIFCRPFLDFSHVLVATEIDMFSDTSGKIGMGAICKSSWMYQLWSPEFIERNKPSIEYLELYAVTAAVLTWIHQFKNRRIILFCDNKSVVDMINFTTTSCKNCMVLVRIIVLKGLLENVRIFARHVEGTKNVFADSLSRNKIKLFKDLCVKAMCQNRLTKNQRWYLIHYGPLKKYGSHNNYSLYIVGQRSVCRVSDVESSRSSQSSKISVEYVSNVLERLKNKQIRETTSENYLSVWRNLNRFIINLNYKEKLSWEEKTALFGAYLVDGGVQSSTLKSYFSAIKHILKMDGYCWNENKVLLSSSVKGCRLENDTVKIRLPIQKSLLEMLLFEIERFYGDNNQQPYLELLYKTMFLMGYYGMLRVGELTFSPHTLKARNVHIGNNKDKIMIVLYTSTRKPGGFMQSCVFPCIVKFLVHLLQYLKDTINIIPQTTTKYVVLYENWVTQI